MQFSSSNSVQPGQFYASTVGSPDGLVVSLEECVNCGVSEWGWPDDGFGAPNKNGLLLRFEPGPQTIVIQTREDGVSIDQVVLVRRENLTTVRHREKRSDDPAGDDPAVKHFSCIGHIGPIRHEASG